MATSPAANTPGMLVCRCSSTTMPSSTQSPAWTARALRGWAPMPTTTKSHSSMRPSVVLTRSTLPSPSKASTPVPHEHLDTMVAVHVAVDGANLCAKHTFEGHRERVDDGDLEPALTCGGRDLGTDPAGADDDDLAPAVQSLTQGVGVPDGTQVEHA